MINFDDIDEEILKTPAKNELAILEIADKKILETEINLAPFIEASENFRVISKSSAETCLTMSLQARKIRQSLDKSRTEILKPHQNFIKSINKQAKDYEKKLLDIEESLSNKILIWLENPSECETEIINVDDGTLHKKTRSYFDVVDINLIPREYLIIDESKIKEALKNGVESIAGIKIYKKNEIDLRVKNA